MGDRLTPSDPTSNEKIIRHGFVLTLHTFRRHEGAATLLIHQTKLAKTQDVR
jgi:hypothetical protein